MTEPTKQERDAEARRLIAAYKGPVTVCPAYETTKPTRKPNEMKE